MLMSGCTNSPHQFSLAPSPRVTTEVMVSADTIVSIRSVDRRNQQFLMAVRKEGEEQSRIISSSSNLRQSVEQALIDGWNQIGVGFVDVSPTLIQVEIMDLNNLVTQKKLSYQGVSNMRLQVTVQTETNILTKEYSSKQTNTGSINVDVLKEKQLMDQQLNILLEQILIDQQIIEAMTL